jgi:hypothetical protein
MSAVRVRISRHAVDRWQQRVDRDSTFAMARRDLTSFLATGRVRPTPRFWMRELRPSGGLRFVYSARFPGVCVLVREGMAVTVVTRGLMRRSRVAFGDPGRSRDIRRTWATARRQERDMALEEVA